MLIKFYVGNSVYLDTWLIYDNKLREFVLWKNRT